jgi:hypothetical protein
MEMLRTLKLPRRLAVLSAVLSLSFVIFGLFAFRTISELKVNGPLYERIVQGKDLIADVLPPPQYILESYLVSFQMMATDDQAEHKRLIARFQTLKNDHDTRHAFWSKEELGPDIAEALLKRAYQPAVAFYEIAFKQFIPAIERKDKPASSAAMDRMKVAYDTHLLAINHLVTITNEQSELLEARSKARISSQCCYCCRSWCCPWASALLARSSSPGALPGRCGARSMSRRRSHPATCSATFRPPTRTKRGSSCKP